MKKLSVLFILLFLVSCSPNSEPDSLNETGGELPTSQEETINENQTTDEITVDAETEIETSPQITLELDSIESYHIDDLLVLKNKTLYPTLQDAIDVYNPDQNINFMREHGINFPELDMNSQDYQDLNSTYLYHEQTTISREDAISDTEYLADLFINAFGGVNQFGGKARVEKFVDNMIAKIPLDGISQNNFFDLLSLETSFIYDGHYWLGNISPSYVEQYLDLSNEMFDSYNLEEYTLNYPQVAYNLKLIKDRDVYLDSENSKEVMVNEYFLKAYMDEDMHIYYTYLGVNNFEEINLPSKVEYKDGTSRDLVYRTLKIDESNKAISEYDNKSVDKVLYIDFRGSIFRYNYFDIIDEISPKIPNHPYVIVDLRGNQGGESSASGPVIHGLLNGDQDFWNFSRPYYDVYPYNKEESHSLEDMIGDHHFYTSPNVVYNEVKENKLVLVLIDNHTSSAGEFTASALKSGDKVLILGSNTRGLGSSQIGVFYKLPNTQIPLRLPSNFYVHNPQEYRPETGYEPDIYVDNLDVDKLIEYLNNLEWKRRVYYSSLFNVFGFN